jgi:hypothetical protein
MITYITFNLSLNIIYDLYRIKFAHFTYISFVERNQIHILCKQKNINDTEPRQQA